MFSSIATIRKDVLERLQLPPSWKPVPHLSDAVEALVPVFYIEFTKFDRTAGGRELDRGEVAAGIDLIISDPKTTDGPAEDAVDEHVLHLIWQIDANDDLFWDTAVKRRQDSGSYLWVISIIALAYAPKPTP